MRELTALGLSEVLTGEGIENRESCFYNRFGQLIREPRGSPAIPFPRSASTGSAASDLWEAAVARLGADRSRPPVRRLRADRAPGDAPLRSSAPAPSAPVEADVLIACDGVSSAVRRQLYPDEELRFVGLVTWRGVTRARPFLTGRSYVRAGSMSSGNLVVYPIVDDVDGEGTSSSTGRPRSPTATTGTTGTSRAGSRISFLSTRPGRSTGWTCPT